MGLKITSQDRVEGVVAQGGFTHWVSFGRTRPTAAFSGQRLHLDFDDVTSSLSASMAGYKACWPADIQRLIAFFGTVSPEDRVLINCAQGISRSTAAGFILRCMQLGPEKEQQALDEVVALRPVAMPNTRMVSIADNLMRREHRMSYVVEDYLQRLNAQPKKLITDLG